MSLAGPVGRFPELAKYELVEELGHGGMATVYRARDRRLGREVAVKIIHRHLRENREVAARFASEARAVAKLRHPGIVEVFDVSDEGEESYLVVELVRGTTLRRVLAEQGRLPPEIAAIVASRVADALAHAHAAGVVHRDVKPENVLVATGEARPGAPSNGVEAQEATTLLSLPPRDVAVKLTDFGIAKLLDAQGVTSTGQVLGSPAHMAPEQIEGGDVDARSDVFGLGVLLYEMLVGHLPFEGNNPAQVLRRVLEGKFADAEREAPTVGAAYAAIVAKALAHAAADRFASAAEVAATLRAELERLGFGDRDAELAAFLDDSAAYREKHAARVVDALVARGRAARRERDVETSARDFNRALAYAPHDAALLALVARAARGRAWRRRALWVGSSLAAAAAAVGLSVFAARAARRPPDVLMTDEPIVARELDPGIEALPPVARTTPFAATTAARPVAAMRGVSVLDAGRRRAESAPRRVAFVIQPASAKVRIDGGPLEDVFGLAKTLAPGAHTLVASVENSPCCEQASLSFQVEPDEGTGDQVVRLALRMRDATLTFSGAPPGALVQCAAFRVRGLASQTFSVKMGAPKLDGECSVEVVGLPSRRASVTLQAGQLATVGF